MGSRTANTAAAMPSAAALLGPLLAGGRESFADVSVAPDSARFSPGFAIGVGDSPPSPRAEEEDIIRALSRPAALAALPLRAVPSPVGECDRPTLDDGGPSTPSTAHTNAPGPVPVGPDPVPILPNLFLARVNLASAYSTSANSCLVLVSSVYVSSDFRSAAFMSDPSPMSFSLEASARYDTLG